ncbi:hypothetical protein K458DRAFT_399780 [Lentithecium fluviatile CBS 122367]|uniref:BZIP domain-containing protein n=1 Tax=Lentithecium fluviatile CBS 122367 TaxID=1168545 RepID=A0A6G1JK07_9PLEO|nr:hypothetical protein K458DRAFT_399780 [Lentithecium fluviatile CBS 122367]
MSDSKASKAQNLARIRDNQRRSRARRKEYLHELETKLRSYEQMGIEASTEIQSAARRVLDENRKLRTLLHERGVSDTEIVIALGGPADRPYEHISAVSSLSAMLDRRNTCTIPSIPSCTSSPVSTHSSVVGFSPHAPTVPRVAIPVPRSAALHSNHISSPHTSVSGMDSPTSFHGGTFYRPPMTPASDVKTEDVQPYVPYDQVCTNSWTYQDDTQYITDPVSYYNSSYFDAANIIRTMRPESGAEYESELGRSFPRQDFCTNNPAMYNVLHRYAGPQSA